MLCALSACGTVSSDHPTVDASTSDAPPAVPSIAVSIDPVMTELAATVPVTITITSRDGFSGTVAVAGQLTTPTGDALTAWTLALDPSVDVPAGGSGVVHGTIATKSTAPPTLANTLTVTATSSAATQMATASVTALNQVTLPIQINASNTCVYPPPLGINDPVHIRVGTKVRWLNTGTLPVVIHSNGAADGIAHQTGDTQPGATYEQTLTGTATPVFTWYCHNGNDLGNGDPAIAADE